MSDLIFKEESYAIMGACFNVYKIMGCGFLENVYQECLEIEFEYQEIPFSSQQEVTLNYRDKELKQKYIPDFFCYDKIIIEIKTISEIRDVDESQIINYLNATKYTLGILVNFGHYPKVEYKRFVL